MSFYEGQKIIKNAHLQKLFRSRDNVDILILKHPQTEGGGVKGAENPPFRVLSDLAQIWCITPYGAHSDPL